MMCRLAPLLALVLGCGRIEGDCRCSARACADEVCGAAIRLPDDERLHRLEPALGLTTACGIEVDARAARVDVHEAEDELRAGGGHRPCWRIED